jgi:hypothetical protein
MPLPKSGPCLRTEGAGRHDSEEAFDKEYALEHEDVVAGVADGEDAVEDRDHWVDAAIEAVGVVKDLVVCAVIATYLSTTAIAEEKSVRWKYGDDGALLVVAMMACLVASFLLR